MVAGRRLLVYSAADGGRHSVVTLREKPTAVPLDPPLPRGSSGSPATLFSMDRSIVDFDITSDGPRFLIIPDPPQAFLPLHVLVNWPTRVKH